VISFASSRENLWKDCPLTLAFMFANVLPYHTTNVQYYT